MMQFSEKGKGRVHPGREAGGAKADAESPRAGEGQVDLNADHQRKPGGKTRKRSEPKMK